LFTEESAEVRGMCVELRPEVWMLRICIAPESAKLVEGGEAVHEWVWRVSARGTVEVNHRSFTA
jgi:hypothetical protein